MHLCANGISPFEPQHPASAEEENVGNVAVHQVTSRCHTIVNLTNNMQARICASTYPEIGDAL